LKDIRISQGILIQVQLVNVNSLDYQHYVSSRNAKELKNERVDSMEQDLANLKGEIGEIKSLLKELVNGK